MSKLRIITNRDLYRQKWGIDSDTIILGSIARYDFQKDHAFAVKFMFWLHSTSNFKVKLVFVGDGEEKATIENLINKLDIKDKVIMESPANFKDVMPAFDFYFMHSYYEGFPYVLVVAMFFGLPLLCRNVGGAEIVRDGINGVYLDDFSPERSALKFLNSVRKPQNIIDFSKEKFIEVASELGIFLFGILIGIKIFSKFLSWLLDRYPDKSIAFLIGLMVGALIKVWPWQNQVPNLSEGAPNLNISVLPYNFEGGSPEILKAFILMFNGFILIYIIEKNKILFKK